jgi:S-DNA-T family DNA segregation ATPase FtsK/SpoIIIE
MLTTGVLAATAVVTYLPLIRIPGPFGALADDLVSPVVDSVGYGAAGVIGAWFATAWLYIRRRGPGRTLIRTLGWAGLVAVIASGADWLDPNLRLPKASAYGRGGSVGAWLRLTTGDQLPAFSCWMLWIGGLALSLLLSADRLVFFSAKVSYGSLRKVAVGAKKTNAAVEAGANGMIAGVKKVGGALVKKPMIPLVAAEIETSCQNLDTEFDTPCPNVTTTTAIPITALKLVPRPADNEDDSEEPPHPSFDDGYELPPLSLLADADPYPVTDHQVALRERATLLEKTFLDFGLSVKVVGIHTGPVITQYEIALETGLRLSKVTTLADDLALNLKVQSVRVVAPLPGRNTVGIEVPNEHRQTVRLKELIAATVARSAKARLPIFLGKDAEGRPLVYDLADMPHLLIAGRTGTGKSVCLNAVILSLLLTRRPGECRLIMIDPKKVELADYSKIPHLMHPVVTDDRKAEAILAWAVDKMEERYELLRRARVRNVASYNELAHDEILKRVHPESEDERKQIPVKMPYVVIVVDEVGDLLMAMKKEVESHIIRLAQKSRAAGIHLILATQKPTVDVITGLIKSNLPARICFQVASRSDSAVVLDEKGAEKLLGKGDMLFLQPGTSMLVRAQGAYASDTEIANVVEFLECDTPNYDTELLNVKAKETAGEGGAGFGDTLRDRDPMYEQAIEVVIRERRGSTSLLQRALGIGYGRASRLIDFMAEDGIVGGYNGSNARDVIVSAEDWAGRKKVG